MAQFKVVEVKPLQAQYKKSEKSKKTILAFEFATLLVEYYKGNTLNEGDIIQLLNTRMFIVRKVDGCKIFVQLLNTNKFDTIRVDKKDLLLGDGYITGEATITIKKRKKTSKQPKLL